MNKAEMLKKQAQANTTNLYLSNESTELQQQIDIKSETIQPIKENKVNNIQKENILKMLSFRIPQDIIDNISKYAYVQRMKKQDAIIMIFESFFRDDKAQAILKQYDEIMKG